MELWCGQPVVEIAALQSCPLARKGEGMKAARSEHEEELTNGRVFTMRTHIDFARNV